MTDSYLVANVLALFAIAVMFLDYRSRSRKLPGSRPCTSDACFCASGSPTLNVLPGRHRVPSHVVEDVAEDAEFRSAMMAELHAVYGRSNSCPTCAGLGGPSDLECPTCGVQVGWQVVVP